LTHSPPAREPSIPKPEGIGLSAIAQLFLRLGLTAFGGPAAHIALLHHEVVNRRGWIRDREFAHLLAITNLIPGPNSTEMAIHVGLRTAGWSGFLIAGICFILPAALIVGVLADFYVRAGNTPDFSAVMRGIAPIVVALIVQATIAIGRTSLRGVTEAGIAAAVAILSFAHVNELFLLLVSGAIAAGVGRLRALLPLVILAATPLHAQAVTVAAVPLTSIGVFFLKIGSILFGSGYVLVAFLRADLVERFGWLTDRQLLDAIAIGQVTPGPLFTTATFIGYLLNGVPGAIVATVAIFLPGFFFVAATGRLLPAIDRSETAMRFVDGVVAASIGLMAAVAVALAPDALARPSQIGIFAAALGLLLFSRINSVWLVLGAGMIGYLL
jgi:chromate transporter